MLILLGVIEMKPEELDALEKAASAMAAQTRMEAGNIDYAFSREVGAPGTLRLTEIWSGKEALKAHFDMPHMASFNEAIAASGAQITRFDVFGYESGDAIPLDQLLA
jgi:quinol monooxygenase YgiN